MHFVYFWLKLADRGFETKFYPPKGALNIPRTILRDDGKEQNKHF